MRFAFNIAPSSEFNLSRVPRDRDLSTAAPQHVLSSKFSIQSIGAYALYLNIRLLLFNFRLCAVPRTSRTSGSVGWLSGLTEGGSFS